MSGFRHKLFKRKSGVPGGFSNIPTTVNPPATQTAPNTAPMSSPVATPTSPVVPTSPRLDHGETQSLSSAPQGQTHVLAAPTDPTNLLLTRLENWKANVAFLIDYINIAQSQQKHQVQYLEKTRKALSEVPRFDGGAGSSEPGSPQSPQQTYQSTAPQDTEAAAEPTGMSQALANVGSRLDQMINLATQSEQNLKTSVLPLLEELQSEIEKHIKNLKHSTLKQSKELEKLRSHTHKSIESLGQSTAGFTGTSQSAKHDPYVLKRALLSQVGEQINRENSLSESLLSLQSNIRSFERHIIQVIQRAVQLSSEILSGYFATAHDSYVSFSERFAAISEDYEWNEFALREQHQLVNPNTPKRTLDSVTFPNADNPVAQPLVSGVLQRKEGTIVKNYTSGYYVLTKAGFLHGYASEDPLIEPQPNFSLHIPDTTIGPLAPHGGSLKIKIKGRDTSSTLPTKKTFTLKAASYQELQLWYDAFLKVSGGKANFVSADIDNDDDAVASSISGGSGTAAGAAVGTGEPVDPGFNAPAGGPAHIEHGQVTDHGAIQGKFGGEDVAHVTQGIEHTTLETPAAAQAPAAQVPAAEVPAAAQATPTAPPN